MPKRKKNEARSGYRWHVGDLADIPGPAFFDDAGGCGLFLLAIALGIALVVALVAGAPVLVFFAEVVLFVIASVAAVLWRTVFRRPWTVVARSAGEEHRFGIVGLRAGNKAVDELAGWIRSGGSPTSPPPTLTEPSR